MAIIKATNSKAGLKKAINYITKEEKTEEKLISGFNCSKESAFNKMMFTKELYKKKDGRQYVHYVQSFAKDDNITAEISHKIAEELAEKEFKGFEVLIATHKDREHIHNHFIINSVSFETGLKFQSSKNDLAAIKKSSDLICEREGLSVIKGIDKEVITSFELKKYKTLEKGFENTYKSYMVDLYKDCKEVLEYTMGRGRFIEEMNKKGYEVDWSDNKKNIVFTTAEGKKVRNSNLSKTFKEDFSKENIMDILKVNLELKLEELRKDKIEKERIIKLDKKIEEDMRADQLQIRKRKNRDYEMER